MAETQTPHQPQDPSAHAHGHTLGLAGRMTRAFIHSPLSPLLLLASLSVGILGLLFTPRQEDPQISVPMIDVFFGYPGASAEQVASLAVDPLERIMSEIPGVKHVYSASQRGGGMVTVEFDVGEEMEPSLVKLYDKLMSNMDKVPPGVTEPLVKPKGVDDVPVVTLTLWSHDLDDAALRLIGLDVLQRLKEVPDTSQSFIVGGRSEQIRVEVFPERLAGYGVSAGQLAHTISTANAEQGAGYAESAGGSFELYSGAFLTRAEDIERLVVGVRNGAPIYVRDVALVREVAEETRALVQYYTGRAYGQDFEKRFDVKPPIEAGDGTPAVTIAVAKKPGTNGVTVAAAILEQVEQLKGRIIPDNVQIAVTRNYGETANDKVNELIFKLFIATGAVTLLIWFFLGFRAAVVVLIVIPVVILVTVFSAWLLGYTIDRVSLFALIFSIGILVDDAIVVIENIYRRWLIKGEVDTETSVDAVREVGNPTILATFTVIAALLPMGFVSGMMGPYMEPIPVLGSVAMLFSLFAAFIFTPWLAIRIRPSLAKLDKAQVKEHRQSERLDGVFRRMLTPLIDHRGRQVMLRVSIYAVFALLCAMFYTTHVTVKMLPFDNKPEFNVVVNMPDGTALPETANVIQRLSEEVLDIPEVVAIQTYAGTASPFNFNGLVRHYYLRQDSWQGDIQIQLLHKNDRERSSHQIASAAREALTPIASDLGAKIQIVEMPPGPPVLQTIVAEIYGPDQHTRRKVARDITGLFEEAPSVVDVDNYLQDPYEIWRFVVDREKAVRRGVSVEDVNTQLGMVMGDFKLGDVKVGRVLEPRYITLQAPMALRSQFSRMGELPIPSSQGNLIPLGELGQFERITQDPIVFHKDLRPVEYVTGDVAGRLGAPIYGMLEVEDLLADYVAPDGIRVETEYLGPPKDSFASAFEWTGEWTVTYETFRDMGLAFAAAMVLIYMLVVWEFGNFRLPGIIMAPIPLTLIGIIPGHWLFDAEFTATSMIGFIALAGIIVRNSILLVDFSKQAVEAGTDLREAVIQSCRTRTRPILITAFALVLGSSVILTDPIFEGMAISLMFGVMVSTLLTLVIIPLGCVRARNSFAIPPADPAVAAAAPAPAMAAPAAAGAAAAPGAAASPTGFADEAGKPGRLARIGRAVFMAPAILLMFLGAALQTIFGRFQKFPPVRWITMIVYGLRALPYFVMLFLRETFKSKGGGDRAPQPAAAAPAPSAPPAAAEPAAPQPPAPAAPPEPEPAPEPVVPSEPVPEPAELASEPAPEPAPPPAASEPASPVRPAEKPARKPVATERRTIKPKPPAPRPEAPSTPAATGDAAEAGRERETTAAPAPARPGKRAIRPRPIAPKKAAATGPAEAGKAERPAAKTAKAPGKKPAADEKPSPTGRRPGERRGIRLRIKPGQGKKPGPEGSR